MANVAKTNNIQHIALGTNHLKKVEDVIAANMVGEVGFHLLRLVGTKNLNTTNTVAGEADFRVSHKNASPK